jgi:hypothetical protein
VLTFGTGDTGQLGLGETMERKKPALVKIELEDGLIEVILIRYYRISGHWYSDVDDAPS